MEKVFMLRRAVTRLGFGHRLTNPRQLIFVWWHLIFVGPQYGTCVISPIWHLKF